MRCSARSFSSASSSSASALSSSGVAPRGREPAIGCSIARPSATLTRASGDDPTTSKATSSDNEPSAVATGTRRRYMYGLGLVTRSTR